MSNIQDTAHIRYTIKSIKSEIKNHTNLKEKKTYIDNTSCVNALTGIKYSFQKGSTDEKTLFRVMPLNGVEKIYFDSQDEYTTWARKQYKRNST